MKLTTFTGLLATLAATSQALTPQGPQTVASPSEEIAPEPTPFLEVRQAGDNYNPDATAGPSQYPIATTNWEKTILPNSQVTYVPVAYTQKFSRVPDQLPSPGVGEIGYGTLKAHHKRQAAPEPTQTQTDFGAQAVVIVLRTAVATQNVQAVAMVQVVGTVVETSLGTVFVDAPPPPAPTNATSADPTGTGGVPFATGYGTGNSSYTMNGTGVYGTGSRYATGTGTSLLYFTVGGSGLATPTAYNLTLSFPAL